MTLFTAMVTVLLTAGPNTKLLVSADWLLKHREDKNVVVVHVAYRAGEYAKGHIPGSVELLWEDFVLQTEDQDSDLPTIEKLKTTFERVGVSDNSTVIVYGDPIAAARAFMTLEYLGHRDVRVLDGSLAAWKAAGQPVVTDDVVARAGKLTVKPRNFVVDAAWVEANRTNPKFALIDARPLNEFTGSDDHEGMHKGGHIPGAQNIYWTRFLKSRDEPVLLPVAELQSLFKRAGATEDKTVIVYCMVGMRASVAYFVSRYLGYDTKFYDGSWVDWSARGLPFVKGGEAVK